MPEKVLNDYGPRCNGAHRTQLRDLVEYEELKKRLALEFGYTFKDQPTEVTPK